MHRPTVGIVAVVLLVAGAVGQFWAPTGRGYEGLSAGCWRVGVVLLLVWLALPQLRKIKNKFLFGATLVSIMVVAVRPRLLPFAAVALLILAILRPRERNTPPAKPSK